MKIVLCKICSSDFSANKNEAFITYCGHLFHASCLTKNIDTNNSEQRCPTCTEILYAHKVFLEFDPDQEEQGIWAEEKQRLIHEVKMHALENSCLQKSIRIERKTVEELNKKLNHFEEQNFDDKIQKLVSENEKLVYEKQNLMSWQNSFKAKQSQEINSLKDQISKQTDEIDLLKSENASAKFLSETLKVKSEKLMEELSLLNEQNEKQKDRLQTIIESYDKIAKHQLKDLEDLNRITENMLRYREEHAKIVASDGGKVAVAPENKVN